MLMANVKIFPLIESISLKALKKLSKLERSFYRLSKALEAVSSSSACFMCSCSMCVCSMSGASCKCDTSLPTRPKPPLTEAKQLDLLHSRQLTESRKSNDGEP